jgi:hypothetical protein
LPFFAAEAALKEAKERALSGFGNREVLRRKGVLPDGVLAYPILDHETYRFIPILWPRFRSRVQRDPVTVEE